MFNRWQAALFASLLAAPGAGTARSDETPPPPKRPPVSNVLAQPRPSSSYCRDFADRVEAEAHLHPNKAVEVAELIREGKVQCAAGNMPSGLHRLHIALAILTGG